VLGFELAFIGRKHDFSRPFADERLKMIGLFGPLRALFDSCST
jgi:hypothetical protein